MPEPWSSFRKIWGWGWETTVAWQCKLAKFLSVLRPANSLIRPAVKNKLNIPPFSFSLSLYLSLSLSFHKINASSSESCFEMFSPVFLRIKLYRHWWKTEITLPSILWQYCDNIVTILWQYGDRGWSNLTTKRLWQTWAVCCNKNDRIFCAISPKKLNCATVVVWQLQKRSEAEATANFF